MREWTFIGVAAAALLGSGAAVAQTGQRATEERAVEEAAPAGSAVDDLGKGAVSRAACFRAPKVVRFPGGSADGGGQVRVLVAAGTTPTPGYDLYFQFEPSPPGPVDYPVVHVLRRFVLPPGTAVPQVLASAAASQVVLGPGINLYGSKGLRVRCANGTWRFERPDAPLAPFPR